MTEWAYYWLVAEIASALSVSYLKPVKMSDRCLYCYEAVEDGRDLHQACSLKFFGTVDVPELPYDLDQMSELAKHVVERSVAVPGVQAKLSMSLVDETLTNGDGRLTVVGALGGNLVLKPPAADFPEMPANEHVTMRIAEDMGIRTVPSSLIRLRSGELAYITKRIDRTENGEKIHMLDMFQVLEAFDKYLGSMEKVGKAIGRYSGNTMLDKLFFFELTLFSFVTGNNDMHLKNFSLIRTEVGWSLAPAYDLLNVTILNSGDTEELALPIEGKKRKLTRAHFERFGNGLGLTPKQVKRAFSRLHEHREAAHSWLSKCFLSAKMKEAYAALLEARYAQL